MIHAWGHNGDIIKCTYVSEWMNARFEQSHCPCRATKDSAQDFSYSHSHGLLPDLRNVQIQQGAWDIWRTVNTCQKLHIVVKSSYLKLYKTKYWQYDLIYLYCLVFTCRRSCCFQKVHSETYCKMSCYLRVSWPHTGMNASLWWKYMHSSTQTVALTESVFLEVASCLSFLLILLQICTISALICAESTDIVNQFS